MLQGKIEQTGSWEPCRLPLCQQSAHEGSGNLDFLKAGERNCKGTVLRGLTGKIAAKSASVPGLCQNHRILLQGTSVHSTEVQATIANLKRLL